MVYEQLDMIKPQRTPTNRRRYSQRDVMKLQAIQKLTRRHGCNLAGARFILALLKQLHDHAVEPPARFRDVDVSLLRLWPALQRSFPQFYPLLWIVSR
jgi:DNA-binding transcriptional MerR regulator